MTCQIMGTKISLGLDDPPNQSSVSMPVDEKLAEQLFGNFFGRLLIKSAE